MAGGSAAARSTGTGRGGWSRYWYWVLVHVLMYMFGMPRYHVTTRPHIVRRSTYVGPNGPTDRSVWGGLTDRPTDRLKNWPRSTTLANTHSAYCALYIASRRVRGTRADRTYYVSQYSFRIRVKKARNTNIRNTLKKHELRIRKRNEYYPYRSRTAVERLLSISRERETERRVENLQCYVVSSSPC